MKNHQHSINCTHCGCENQLFKANAKHFDSHDFVAKFIETVKKQPKIDLIESSVLYYVDQPDSAIYTMQNGKLTPVDAMGIYQGKVATTGSLPKVAAEMQALTKGMFREVALRNGRTIIPGFVEPHVHILSSSLIDTWINLSGIVDQRLSAEYDLDWVKNEIARHLDEFGQNDWVLGKEVDPALMPFTLNEGKQLNDLTTLDLKTMDGLLETQRPLLLLSASAHTFYANSLVTEQVYAKFKSDQDFQAIFKSDSLDAFKARTNGQFQEVDEMNFVFKTLPVSQAAQFLSPENIADYLLGLFKEASSKGITTLNDASLTTAQAYLLNIFATAHPYINLSGGIIIEKEEDLPDYDYSPNVKEHPNVRVSAAKLVSDGSNQGLTGYQSKAYCCNPDDNLGLFNFDYKDSQGAHKPNYNTLVSTLTSKKWPLMIHANGDKAIDYALDVIEQALDGKADKKTVHRIEHCSILSTEEKGSLERMVNLDVVPSFLIGHVGYWGYAFREAIFEEKAERIDLCKSSLDRGLKISLHSDFPVSPLGPLRMMEQSVTRIMEGAPEIKENHKALYDEQTLDNNTLVVEERISPEEALSAVTYSSAYQCSAPKGTGTLTENCPADFVMLRQNPILMDTAQKAFLNMRNIEVLETWKGGTQVF